MRNEDQSKQNKTQELNGNLKQKIQHNRVML